MTNRVIDFEKYLESTNQKELYLKELEAKREHVEGLPPPFGIIKIATERLFEVPTRKANSLFNYNATADHEKGIFGVKFVATDEIIDEGIFNIFEEIPPYLSISFKVKEGRVKNKLPINTELLVEKALDKRTFVRKLFKFEDKDAKELLPILSVLEHYSSIADLLSIDESDSLKSIYRFAVNVEEILQTSADYEPSELLEISIAVDWADGFRFWNRVNTWLEEFDKEEE